MNSQNTTTPSVRPTIRDRIAGSRFLSYSLLIHAILVPLLTTLVIIVRNQEPEEMPSGTMYSAVALPDPGTPAREETGPKFEDIAKPASMEPLVPPSGLQTITSNSLTPVFRVPSANAMRFDGTLTMTPEFDPRALTNEGLPKTLPGIFGDRFKKDGMGRIVGTRNKPSPPKESEDAVLRALKWLRAHQNADGSWAEKNKGAMTGLALLCFLGHGELGDSAEFGLTVNRAIEWIIANGTKFEGRLAMTGADWGPGNGGVYEHGIATYALAEYYTLTHSFGRADERAVELLRQAIGHIVNGQGPDGGWMYRFDKSQGDTSVSGWQIQALKAAHLTGLDFPGVSDALDRAMRNLDRVRGPKGGYGYRGPEDRYSLTGVGVLSELFWKGERSADMRRAIEFISDTTRRDLPLKYTHEKADLYAWYYHTQAMLMFGGDAWRVWERRFSPEIIAAQSPDGSWPKMASPGHGNLQNAGTLTGAVYRTTLCTLMLESYYRYSPTLRAETASPPLRVAGR